MHKSDRAVADLVQLVRRRYRQRMPLQGAAVTALALAASLAATATIYATTAQSVTVLLVGAILTAAIVIVTATLFLFRPSLRRLSDESVALFIEEHTGPGRSTQFRRRSGRRIISGVGRLLTSCSRMRHARRRLYFQRPSSAAFGRG